MFVNLYIHDIYICTNIINIMDEIIYSFITKSYTSFIIQLSTSSVQELIVILLPWFLSITTLWITFITGNKHPRTWFLGLINQALWLVWILLSKSWGLIPLNVGLWIIYYRNHRKWMSK
jgi:hypothetical protein